MANLKAKMSTGTLKGKSSGIPALDKTLTTEGKAADAKAVGDKIEGLNNFKDTLNASKIPFDNTNSNVDATNVQSAIDTIAQDYIIETGNSNGFSYYKWKSGKVEAHGKKTIPLIFNVALKNNLWKGIPTNAADMTDTAEGANNTFVPFPKDASGKILFKSAEYANIISAEYSRNAVRTVQLLSLPLERNGFVFFVTKDFGGTSNSTAESITLYFHIIGSWKE